MSNSASTSSVYRVTELIGTSESSWEDAAKCAVETATKTLRDLRVAEVKPLRNTIRRCLILYADRNGF